MSSSVLHAPRTIGFGARLLAYVAIGLIAAALVVAVLVSSAGSSTTSHIPAGRALPLSLPDDAATARPAPSVSMGRPHVPEPNLLPK